MAEPARTETEPPKLVLMPTGQPENNSLADVIEWFLAYDERTARIRHAHSNELFLWKQSDDKASGVDIYPFDNAEARFAIGVFQALEQNTSEPLLKLWITDVLNALHESRETRTQIAETYRLDDVPDASPLEKAEKLTTRAEKRIYLTSCWLEALCTAEARVLGWVYQEMYGRPFAV